jgi:hypothetical protein
MRALDHMIGAEVFGAKSLPVEAELVSVSWIDEHLSARWRELFTALIVRALATR